MKILVRVLVVAVVVVALVAFFGYRLLTRSLPQTSGELSLTILEEPVHVYRDALGIPHILARNERDLFRAVGYVTAQDRLWQMDFNRRVARGRLSEIFGPAMLESDRFVRTWGMGRVAERLATEVSEQTRQALTAYAEGVNAFIETHGDRLPLEFSILGYKPEPWEIEDTIALGRLMAWRLSFGWYVDLTLQEVVAKVGRQKAREIFPGFPKEGPFIIPRETEPFWTQSRPFVEAGLALRELLGMHTGQVGSNSWAVSGAKSACGKPLLANDPHLALTAPSVWYEMHLSDGETNVAGVVLPGTPVVMIGHNESVAWGLTNGMIDDVDFYLEKVNPDNPRQYWNGREWADFEVVEELIAVKDAAPETLRVRLTRNGPVVSELHPLAQAQPYAVSLRWTGHLPSDELATFLKLHRARSWEDLKEAVRHFRVPAQNFLFASASGDIGYYLAGAIPIRKGSNGVLPHEGWREQGQWVDWVPFEAQPHVLNPPEGFIVTANNKIVDDRYPYYVGNLWEPPYRAARIRQVLQQSDSLTLEDFEALQTDVTSLHAREILPGLIQAAQAALDTAANPRLQTLYDLLKTWDGQEDTESVAASIFHAFFLKVTENTLKDELGDTLYTQYVRVGNVPARVMTALLKKESSAWFDDVSTDRVETKAEILVRSLLDAGAYLTERRGDSIGDWKWGELHAQWMYHPLGRRKPLDVIFNLGPFQRGGSKMTVNNAEYRFGQPFAPILGPSTRQLVDFCDVHAARSVITTGQSGHPLSEHYKDQTELWLTGRTHPLTLNWAEIVEGAPEHLVLQPGEE